MNENRYNIIVFDQINTLVLLGAAGGGYFLFKKLKLKDKLIEELKKEIEELKAAKGD